MRNAIDPQHFDRMIINGYDTIRSVLIGCQLEIRATSDGIIEIDIELPGDITHRIVIEPISDEDENTNIPQFGITDHCGTYMVLQCEPA